LSRSIISSPSRNNAAGRPQTALHGSNGARESPFFSERLHPTGGEEGQAANSQRQITSESPARSEPATPTNSIVGGIKKFWGYLTGTPAANEGQHLEPATGTRPTSVSPQSDVSPERDGRDSMPTPLEEPVHDGLFFRRSQSLFGSPSPPQREPPLGGRFFELFAEEQARRLQGTSTWKTRQGASKDTQVESYDFFAPLETADTRKRKLASINGEMPPSKRGNHGVGESYVNAENEADSTGESRPIEEESMLPTTPLAKKQTLAAQTPLRSAMRHTGSNINGTVGRSGKSVRINPKASVKCFWGDYGPAGHYRGGIFAEPNQFSEPNRSSESSRFSESRGFSTDSEESISFEAKSWMSPTTMENTRVNGRFKLDRSVFDPQDEAWRPSLANPRPGHFRVPDLDEEDEDETILEQHNIPSSPPQTPRMSHAELPPSPSTGATSLSFHADSIVGESTELKLSKARSEAQKYKPEKSSRLSLVEPAPSRSSSPPSSTADHAEETPATTLRPTVPFEELDNTMVGEDGMTNYQREHQYDDWARNVLGGWPEPQTYEDAGTATPFIADLVRKTWTPRDDEESDQFWDKIYPEVETAQNEAKARGLRLEFITSPA